MSFRSDVYNIQLKDIVSSWRVNHHHAHVETCLNCTSQDWVAAQLPYCESLPLGDLALLSEWAPPHLKGVYQERVVRVGKL